LLLAVKLALEEWRHWLKGSKQPFLVWTDHKNLAYIQSAKRLNSRKARWALFFSRFNFSLTYRPGSRNVKPDALSRLYSSDIPESTAVSILPKSCVVGALSLEINNIIQEALREQPDPGNGPPNRQFVPDAARSKEDLERHSLFSPPDFCPEPTVSQPPQTSCPSLRPRSIC